MICRNGHTAPIDATASGECGDFDATTPGVAALLSAGLLVAVVAGPVTVVGAPIAAVPVALPVVPRPPQRRR